MRWRRAVLILSLIKRRFAQLQHRLQQIEHIWDQIWSLITQLHDLRDWPSQDALARRRWGKTRDRRKQVLNRTLKSQSSQDQLTGAQRALASLIVRHCRAGYSQNTGHVRLCCGA